MANRIYLFCGSSRQISYDEIIEQMGHMGFLDQPARFEPPVEEGNKARTDWGAFELHYREGRRPITVEQITDDVEIRTVLSEICEKFDDEPKSSVRAMLKERLQSAKHGLMFELPDELPEDVWEMLDATEGYFAGVCDGVIVAHEGVFDANLQLVFRWSHPGI